MYNSLISDEKAILFIPFWLDTSLEIRTLQEKIPLIRASFEYFLV